MLAVDIQISGSFDFLGPDRQADIEKLEEDLSHQIVVEAHRLMDDPKRSGRLYPRQAITGRRTAQGIAAGLRRSGKTRMVTGRTFHRASAPGEAIVKDTGQSYRDISVRRTSKGTYRIRFGGWTGYWELAVPENMRRRTIMPAIEAAVQKVFSESPLFQ